MPGETSESPFGGGGFAGADTISRGLRQAARDASVRAIVLRVDSPGGSGVASDLIWRETVRMKKPVIVSMGNVAGSGGYYVSLGSGRVLADPATITGSIGVVSMHFDVSGLLRKLGISAHTIKEGKNPDMGELWRPYTADQKQRIEASMRRTYDLFRRRVSDARELSMEKVDELGRGHVYSGTDAKALGLVDQLGGLHQAIAVIRQRAGIAPRRTLELRVLPRRQTLLDLLLGAMGILHFPTTVLPVCRLEVTPLALVEDDHSVNQVPSSPGELNAGTGELCLQARQVKFDDVEPGNVAAVQKLANALGVLMKKWLPCNIFICDMVHSCGLCRDWYARVDPVTLVLLAAVRLNLEDGQFYYSVRVWIASSSFDINECQRSFESEVLHIIYLPVELFRGSFIISYISLFYIT